MSAKELRMCVLYFTVCEYSMSGFEMVFYIYVTLPVTKVTN